MLQKYTCISGDNYLHKRSTNQLWGVRFPLQGSDSPVDDGLEDRIVIDNREQEKLVDMRCMIVPARKVWRHAMHCEVSEVIR